MLLHNFDATKDKDVISDICLDITEDFNDVFDLMKIILLIPSNSAWCERGDFNKSLFALKKPRKILEI